MVLKKGKMNVCVSNWPNQWISFLKISARKRPKKKKKRQPAAQSMDGAVAKLVDALIYLEAKSGRFIYVCRYSSMVTKEKKKKKKKQ